MVVCQILGPTLGQLAQLSDPWSTTFATPNSNESWPKVGSLSGRQYRRWANLHRCWGRYTPGRHYIQNPWTVSLSLVALYLYFELLVEACHLYTHIRQGCFNSSPPSTVYMRQWTRSAMVQVMTCRLFGATPLPGPILTYCQLDPQEETSMKIELKYKAIHSLTGLVNNWNTFEQKWGVLCPK